MLFSFLLSAFLLTSCRDDDPIIEVTVPTQNIVQIAQANGFTSLAAALTKAELIDALQANSKFTVFAPTNKAFDDLLKAIGQTSLDDIPASVLEQILLYHVDSTLASVLTYHVVGAKVLSTGIPREAATVNGNTICFSLVSVGNFINGNTEIVAVDIVPGSGVVHVIDNVLLPPSGDLVATAIELSTGREFTSLIAALQRTANEGTADQNLITVLSGAGPFTVFAPTNAVFQAVLDSNPAWNSLGDIPLETLIAVLTYHVVPARAYDKNIEGAVNTSGELTTANGENIQIDLSTRSINGTSNITGINYNATNGVIHVILP